MLTISVSYETITVVTALLCGLVALYLVCGSVYEGKRK